MVVVVVVAIVALALLAAGLGGALVWALRGLSGANNALVAAGKDRVQEMEDELALRVDLTKQRDDARAAATRLGVELNAASAEVESLRDLLEAAREEIADARKHAVLDAPPEQRGDLVDELLRRRVAEVAARRAAAGTDRGAAAADAVQGPGPTAGAAGPAGRDPQP